MVGGHANQWLAVVVGGAVLSALWAASPISASPPNVKNGPTSTPLSTRSTVKPKTTATPLPATSTSPSLVPSAVEKVSPATGWHPSKANATPSPSSPGTPKPGTPPTPPTPTPAPPPPPPSPSYCAAVGFFDNSDSPGVLASLASQLGVRATVLTTYAWPDVAQAAAGAVGPPFTHFEVLMPPQADTGLQILLGVGAVTPAQATAIGDNLVANGYTNTIIRIMWEMNGNWFPWGTQTYSAAQYIAIYQAAEQAFAAVPGNHFTYAWNISAGTAEAGRTEFDTYPGNAYVSSVGIDVYDEWGMDSNLPAIASFAHSVGRPISLDEWGLDGSDDPGFISTVAAFINNPANDVTLQSYFNNGANAITQYPASEAQYVRDFSGC
jgi:Glycosyl hydrolase family 26